MHAQRFGVRAGIEHQLRLPHETVVDKDAVAEHGAEAIEMMRRIKRALDPQGILNPGKMFR